MQRHVSQGKIKKNTVILPDIQSRNKIKSVVQTNSDYSGIEAHSQTIENQSKYTKRASACKSSMQHQRGVSILNSYESKPNNQPFRQKHSRSSTSQGVYPQHQPSPGGRKKGANETHHHHHYHIDINVHQVNNILVNYGILPRQIHATAPFPP